MTRLLIEAPHKGDQASCDLAAKIFISSGSHFLTNAEWGCKEGYHNAWLFVEAENKTEAKRILPPAYREGAKIIETIQYTKDDFENPDQDPNHT
jgi:hypothetical protein